MTTAFAHHAQLQQLAANISELNMLQLFKQEPARATKHLLQVGPLQFDYSKHLINDQIMQALLGLAEDAGMQPAIKAMFAGETLNNTEQRAALHVALRADEQQTLVVDGQDLMAEVRAAKAKMRAFVDRVHSGEHAGYTGKRLTQIVNIGIGGSFLGPKVVSDALAPYQIKGMEIHFIANIDGANAHQVLAQLDPETTLFVISSKSFGTLETLSNANTCRKWFLATGAKEEHIKHHFVAVTTAEAKATAFGIDAENLFPMWDWVGGRYSLWSAIGLPQALVLGMPIFERLLTGARQMDQHFVNAPLAQNMPVIAGLLSVWYHNYLDSQAHAVLVYDESLKDLPNHLQQLDMESNGKSAKKDGSPVSAQTGPVIWGGVGTNGQHAYHQLLHQGTRLIPVDFILPWTSHYETAEHHPWLVANCLAQAQALLAGRSLAEVEQELAAKGMPAQQIAELAPHKVIAGNRPSSLISFDLLTPEALGALVAFYEHRTYVQSVIWQINAFDQWGVELGKVMGDRVFEALATGDIQGLDGSTAIAVNHYRLARKL